MLNIAASGCFYERAKSRRLRTNEVFRSTAEGQAVVNEAVPLGLKRKLSGDRSQKASGVLREGMEAMRRMKSGSDETASGKMEKGVSFTAQKSMGASNHADFDSSVVDLTKEPESQSESESWSNLEESKPLIQITIGDIVVVTHTQPNKNYRQGSLFGLCMQETLDLNAISDLIASKEERRNPSAKTSDKAVIPKRNDMSLAIWACCHGKRSSRRYAALLLLLNAGADANVIYITFSNKSCPSPARPATDMAILDSLYDLHLSYQRENVRSDRVDARYIRDVTRVLISFGAEFHKYSEVADAKNWLESFHRVE